MRRLAVIICSLLLALAAHAQDASVLLAYVTAESGWNPRNLGTKLACWFDASDAATLLDAGGAPADAGEAVQTWQDKSGNGRHATAPAEAQRPTRQVGVQNGRAVVRTAGAAQLNIGSAGAVFRNKTAGYIFAVVKDADQAGGDGDHTFVAWSRNSAGSSRVSLAGRNAIHSVWSTLGRRTDADSLAVVQGSAATGHHSLLVFSDWAGGYLRYSIDGADYTSAAYSTGAGASSDTDSTQSVMFRYSAANECPANSEIAEVIVVNAAMSAGEIAATQAYLKAKWGTP